ncbi:MAG: GNAT family N-acetyltransferase [Hyphomicrobiales bacterium]
MTFRIRPTTLENKAIVELILAASYGTLLKGFYDESILASAVPFMSTAQPALLGCGTYYIAENGPIAGACGGWTTAVPGGSVPEDKSIAHIRHVATHPGHLRKGLARRIIERCFSEAKTAGVARFSCFSSLAAVAFYESVGFHQVEEKSVAFKPDLIFPMMEMGMDL